MCPDERKKVEAWAKDAGIVEDEIKDVVDMEMRYNLVNGRDEGAHMSVSIFYFL